MSNVAFDLEVLKQVAAATPVPGGSASLPFAALGAIGPDIYQYVPISANLSTKLGDAVKKAIASLTPAMVNAGTLPTVDISAILSDPTLGVELFEKPLMAAYSVLFTFIVIPFWPIFQMDAGILNQLQTAANNEDGNALKSLSSQLSQLTSDGSTLATLVPTMSAVLVLITELLALPPAIELTGATDKPWLPESNRLFEFLRWHKTDVFTQNLVNSATTNNQRAFAYGYQCHVAASVTGKPFINSIVGGPYRTHWWRNRFVSNYVDAWIYGRYETSGASMSGNTPTPAYGSWANLSTSGNLQNQFNVAGLTEPAGQLPPAINAIATGNLGSPSLASLFPTEISAYVEKAINATYPAIEQPPGFAGAIGQAFVGLFGVVWFMTSGFGPMTPLVLGAAPSSCTTQPSWVTSHGSPPSPVNSGPSTGATVCGVILAILALILFIFGAFTGGSTWSAGVAAVIGAVKAFTSGGSIDWDTLQCDIFWLRNFLLTAELAIAKTLVDGGLAYPAPARLGNSVGGMVTPQVDNSGVPLTKSVMGGSVASITFAPPPPYPLQLDKSNPLVHVADLDFGSYPPANRETPQTTSFPLAEVYADSVVNGNPASGSGILTSGGTFPGLTNVFFGDAVSNAKILIAAHSKGMPRFNLDADRGYGWWAWGPAIGSFPGNGSVINPIKNE
jgi:hypothetical protein